LLQIIGEYCTEERLLQAAGDWLVATLVWISSGAKPECFKSTGCYEINKIEVTVVGFYQTVRLRKQTEGKQFKKNQQLQ